jgi:predicted ATPase
MVETIATQAEGNPLYIEELIKVLMEDGVLSRSTDNDGWIVDQSKLERRRVPPTLTGLIQARLDKLPNSERIVLQKASVVGRTFWEAALAAVGERMGVALPALQALAKRELIYRKDVSTFIGETEYSFRHVLLRDAIYDTVLNRDRQAYHARTAEWLNETTTGAGREDEFASLIAGHFDQAEQFDAASVWYLRAGERAEDQGAMRFIDRALELIHPEAKRQRMDTLFAKDRVLTLLGDLEERLATLNSLAALARDLGDDYKLAAALTRLGFCLRNLGRHQEEMEAYEASLDAARISNNQPVEALNLSLMAHCLLRKGDIDQAFQSAIDGLQVAESLDDETYKARVLTNIAAVYSDAGDLAQAVRLIEEIVAICAREEEPFGQAINLSNLGYNYILLGLPDVAVTHLNQAILLCEKIGANHQLAHCQLNMGLASLRTGDLVQGQDTLEKAIEALDDFGDRFGMASGNLYLGLVLELTGECDEALSLFERARTLFTGFDMPGYEVDAASGMARCYLARENNEAAFRLANQVWEYLEISGTRGIEFPALAYLTSFRVFESQDKSNLSKEVLIGGYNDLMRSAERIGDPAWRQSFLENIPEHQAIIERYTYMVE